MRSLLFILLTAAIITSCNKDEGEQFADEIVGTWSLVAGTGEYETTTVTPDYTASAETISQVVDPTTYELELSSDGTLRSRGSITYDVVETMDGQTYPSTVTMSGLVGDGTYRVMGNRLITKDTKGIEFELTIVSLTGTELVVSKETNQSLSGGGSSSETWQKDTQVYERVD
ncbi:MAG: lipocalin family protein [Lewinella sp.]